MKVAEAMQRIALLVEYDGTGLCGWQRQINGPSVQQELEESLARIESCDVRTVAAGRTDAGVHADAMLVHADVKASRYAASPMAYVYGVNQRLPAQIRVRATRAVPPDFHARFDCRERAYRYQIWNRRSASAIERWRHWWVPRPLDIAAMQQASEYLLGCHDFSSLRASGCQAASPVREMRAISIERSGCRISIRVRAEAFLYHMVRNMAGSLVQVGIGRWTPEKMQEILALKDRSQAAAMAPAHGLYFNDAVYDDFTALDLSQDDQV